VIVEVGIRREPIHPQHRQRLPSVNAFVAIEGECRVVEHIEAMRDQPGQYQADDQRPLGRLGACHGVRRGPRNQPPRDNVWTNHALFSSPQMNLWFATENTLKRVNRGAST